MSLEFCSFSSGSSGNSYLVKSGDTNIIVDVGISGKRIMEGLASCNVSADNVAAILMTHEHYDHVAGLRVMSKKVKSARLLASEGTGVALKEKFPIVEARLEVQKEMFTIGNITINPILLSHDAQEPTGYTFEADGRRITIITDTGVFTREMIKYASKSNGLVLEANHEVNILKCGPYPYQLKRRIMGELGHLSNETAAEFIYEMMKSEDCVDMPKVMLAHLSNENNSPLQAEMTIKNRLFEEDIMVKRDLEIKVLDRRQPSSLIKV